MQPSHKGALSGVRVLDFSWIVAGPTCTTILAEFGAEVIKVESRDVRDMVRGAPAAGAPPGPNSSGMFNNLNRNKLGLSLNVVHPKGFELIQHLVSISDVVVENFSAGTLADKWNLGYEEQRKLRPDIIYCSLSGFGHTGRSRDNTTWGPIAQALSGLTFMSGLPDQEPAGWGFSYMDQTAGFEAAIAVLMALHHRNRTGQGQWIDMSQVEGGIVLTGSAILDFTVNGRRYRRPGNPPANHADHPRVAPHNAYRCAGEVVVGDGRKDGRWCAIACYTEDQWRALCRVMAQPGLAADSRFATNLDRLKHQDQLDALIDSWTRDKDARQLMHTLQAAGVPAGMVQNARDKVEDDPHLKARNFIVEADHPVLGTRKFEGIPIHLSETPGKVWRGAPLLGEHSSQVLQELLGLDDSAVAGLEAEGVI